MGQTIARGRVVEDSLASAANVIASRARLICGTRRLFGCVVAVLGASTIASSSAVAQRGQTLHIFSAADSAGLPRDPNGFLLNPRWFGADTSRATKRCDLLRSRGWSTKECFDIAPNVRDLCEFRAGTGHLDRRKLVTTRPGCLSDEERRIVTLNEATQTLGLGLVCVTGSKTGKLRGHVNWFPVTATGIVRWDSYSSGAQDHDVNINLLPAKPNALTWANPQDDSPPFRRMYHTEFYSAETLERLPDGSPSFWRMLRSLLEDKDAEKQLIDGRFAVITGLFGVDGVHGYHAELHPVYAMAILIDSSRSTSHEVREEWAVMFRNMGSEGDCSEGTLPLITSSPESSLQNFILDLGSWPGAGTPRVSLGPTWTSDSSYRPTQVFLNAASWSSRVLLNFRHPRPRPAMKDYVFLGTVYVDWSRGDGAIWKNRFPLGLPSSDTVIVRPADQTPNFGASGPSQQSSLSPRGNDDSSLAGPSRPKRLRVDYTDSLKFLTGGPQLLPETLSVVSPLRVEKTPPWPLPDSVLAYNACSEPAADDPLCLSGKRIALGMTWAPRLGYSPSLSFYSFANCCFREGEGAVTNAVNMLSLFGARVDLRRDAFFPERKDDNGLNVSKSRRTGASIQLSPFLPPITFRVNEKLVLSPYTIGSLGLSWLEHDHGRLIAGWGVGLGVDMDRQELYLETQNTRRGGGYAGHLFWSVGLLLPFH